MSKNRHYSPEYSYFPESFTDLSAVYYDLQEYDLLARKEPTKMAVEDDSGQFTVKPDIGFTEFAEFHGARQGLERPQLLLVRKALQELKIMDSVSYADCYTVMRDVHIGVLDREAYGKSFQFAHRPFNTPLTYSGFISSI